MDVRLLLFTLKHNCAQLPDVWLVYENYTSMQIVLGQIKIVKFRHTDILMFCIDLIFVFKFILKEARRNITMGEIHFFCIVTVCNMRERTVELPDTSFGVPFSIYGYIGWTDV